MKSPEALAWLCRTFTQAGVLQGFLDATPDADSVQLLACPVGFWVAGYQARATEAGIVYLDVSPSSLLLSEIYMLMLQGNIGRPL